MKVEVCYSPQSYPLFENKEAIVVVIDVLRATSAIVTAFYNGVEKIMPVANKGIAISMKQKDTIVAAEQNGQIVDGVEMGNSPFSYMSPTIKGKTIVISTTNGTQAILTCKDAHQVLIGSFLNLNVICDYIIAQNRDVLLLCSGWKNKFNLEDTLFAGAIVNKLTENNTFDLQCDSAIASKNLYLQAQPDLYEFLNLSSHRIRLEKLNLERDVKYCMTLNICPVIPILKGDYLVKI